MQGDVANLDDLDRLYRTVAAEKGVVDIVFANAGFVELLTIDAVTPEHFDKTVNINMRGLLFTVQKALPLMKNGGAIVLTASVVGVMGLPGHDVYGATKAAVRSFARTWAVELKDHGIRVNVVSPGATDTPIIDGQFATRQQVESAKAAFAEQTPRLAAQHRLGLVRLNCLDDAGGHVRGRHSFLEAQIGFPFHADPVVAEAAVGHAGRGLTRHRRPVSARIRPVSAKQL